MRLLNLDQIKALISVIECGSFTAAASMLNLTQPAVSLQIQELENRFQIKLVERNGRRIRVTAAGSELAAIGRKLLEHADDAGRLMRRFGEGYLGHVRIGMSMTILIYMMPAIIREVKEKAPSLELVLQTGFSDSTLQAVRDNELDLGLCTGPLSDRHVDILEIGSDPLVAIFPPDQNDVPDAVTPAMIPKWPIILGNPKSALRKLFADWIGLAGPIPRPILELDNVAGIKAVVSAGLGMAVIPELAVRRNEDFGAVQVRSLDPPILRKLLLVQRKDKAHEPAIQHVREAILSKFAARA